MGKIMGISLIRVMQEIEKKTSHPYCSQRQCRIEEMCVGVGTGIGIVSHMRQSSPWDGGHFQSCPVPWVG